jgi:Domain of unknown function (DUF929)
MARKQHLVLFIVAVALVATVTAALSRRNSAQPASAPAAAPVPVPGAVMDDLTTIPPAVWARAGTAGAAHPIFVGGANSAAANPVVLYIGALYCPYCAAARWSMITALARFGTFSGLSYSASSPIDVYPSTPTFSFYGSRYVSQYIDFQPVELESDVQLPDGRYQPLETPTSEQQALLQEFDGPPYLDKSSAGGIPFILVGGRYMWSGSPFSPAVLAGHTQAEIAATLPAGSGDAARAILVNANQITATICASDGNRPAEVCGDAMIREAIKALPAKAP